RAIIDRAVVTAKRVITDKMDTLKAIAQELITKETLEQEQFYALIGQPVPVRATA
ncbi:MAG: hypothetical protein IT514_16485, partial [Burkholderiales bacterium]|nr:hypothetical protein [Burkholderiales bacterium]